MRALHFHDRLSWSSVYHLSILDRTSLVIYLTHESPILMDRLNEVSPLVPCLPFRSQRVHEVQFFALIPTLLSLHSC